MTTITGTITPGLGIAVNTIALQRQPFIQRQIPMMEDIHPGTMNINIAPKTFKIDHYDYFLEQVPWGENRVEDFGFIKIVQIIFEGKEYNTPGYIYVPYNSKHFNNASQFEVISVLIPNVSYGKTIEIVIDDGKLQIQ